MKKPDNVNIAGGLLLASGIMSLLVIFGLALGTIGIACLWPPLYYGIGSAIYAIVRGSKLIGPNSYGTGVPKAAAIMQIVQLINGDMFGMGLGIAALVLMGGPEVSAWLDGTAPMTQPGQGYGQQSFGQQGYNQQAAPAAPAPARGGWDAPAPASAPPAPPAWEAAPAAPAQGGWGASPAAPPAAAPPDPWGATPSDPWGAAPAQSGAPAPGGAGYSVASWGETPAPAAPMPAAPVPAASNPAHRNTVVEQAIDASKPPAESVASSGGWGGGWGDPDKDQG